MLHEASVRGCGPKADRDLTSDPLLIPVTDIVTMSNQRCNYLFVYFSAGYFGCLQRPQLFKEVGHLHLLLVFITSLLLVLIVHTSFHNVIWRRQFFLYYFEATYNLAVVKYNLGNAGGVCRCLEAVNGECFVMYYSFFLLIG